MSVINLFIFISRPPKSDVCDVCFVEDAYFRTMPNEDADVERRKKWKAHQDLGQSLRDNLNKMKDEHAEKPKNTADIAISIDMQQVIIVPKLPNQSAFFKRKVRIIIIKIFITFLQ